MPNKCGVVNCRGNSNMENRRRVFCLLKKHSERQKWLDVILPRENFVVDPNKFFICEIHWGADPPLIKLHGGSMRPEIPPSIFNVPASCLPSPKPAPRPTKVEDQQLRNFFQKDKITSFDAFKAERNLQKHYKNLIISRSKERLVCLFMTDYFSECSLSVIVENKPTLCSPLTFNEVQIRPTVSFSGGLLSGVAENNRDCKATSIVITRGLQCHSPSILLTMSVFGFSFLTQYICQTTGSGELPALRPYLSAAGAAAASHSLDRHSLDAHLSADIKLKDSLPLSNLSSGFVLRGALKDPHLLAEVTVVEALSHLPHTSTSDTFLLQFSCQGAGGAGSEEDWQLCGGEDHRSEVLRSSTFSLVLTPPSPLLVSSVGLVARVFEALKQGAVPVILGGDAVELPLAEVLDWNAIAVLFPKVDKWLKLPVLLYCDH
ncbi:Exostosin-like [Trinorchestia longiramus]|nr:Exostosin-like [Trinorchestia longiramus]